MRHRPTVLLLLLALAAGLDGRDVFAQLAEPPFAPSLTSSVAGSLVTLSWQPNAAGPPATSYQLEAGTATGLANVAVIPLPSSTTTFQANAPNGAYYVRVRGLNGSTVGQPSNEVIVVVGAAPCVAPGVPTGFTATTSAGGVTLQWNAPSTGSPPTGYRLDVGSSTGGSDIGVFALPATTAVTSPAPPGQYFVRITALSACGNSPPGPQISFVIGGTTTFNPALLVGSWTGTMFNNTRNGLGRPPITSFTLRLDQAPPVGLTRISGQWTDNAGCRNSNIFGARNSQGSYVVSIESLVCNDGDLTLTFTSITPNLAEGRCNGGANCTFRMTK